ncbi:MAG TPA: TonB-dependent receptor, partial [Thermoanaerobaculia bacterium]
YQWVINDRNLASAKYMAIGTNENPDPTNSQLKPGMINWWKWTFGQSIGTSGSFPYIESYKSNRKTLQIDQTHYAAHFLGQHEVKYGIQYTKASGNSMGGYFNGYSNFVYPYPYNYGPATSWWWNSCACSFGGSPTNPTIPVYNNKTYQHPWLVRRLEQEAGAFVDDSWSLNDRFSLNLGFRYDRMSAKYGSGLEYNFPTTPGDISNLTVLRQTAGTGNVFDFKDWSPRLGFAYSLTEDHKTVLRGAAGRYYAPLGVESLRRFGPDLEKETVQQYYWYLPFNDVDTNHNGKVDPSEVAGMYQLLQNRPPDALNSTFTKNPSWQLEVAPGTKSPYTDQFEVSLQRQLGRDFSIEATGIYKRSKNFIAYQEFNTATNQPWQWESVPYTTSTGYQTKVWQIKMGDYNGDGKIDLDDAKFVLNNMGRTATNINSFDGQNVNRSYDGLQLVLTKRYTDRWQGLISANWSHSRGIAMRTVDQSWYIDGPMIQDNAFGTSLNDFQNNIAGPSPMTPRIMLKANGSYTVPIVEMDFGLRWRFDTGRPFWPIENVSSFATWMGAAPNPYVGTAGYNGVFLTGDTNARIVAADVSHPSWTPNTSIFDLSIGKTFRAHHGAALNVSLDVLNAFNEASPNLVGFHTGDFGRVYSITAPRTYRGGVKIMF